MLGVIVYIYIPTVYRLFSQQCAATPLSPPIINIFLNVSMHIRTSPRCHANTDHRSGLRCLERERKGESSMRVIVSESQNINILYHLSQKLWIFSKSPIHLNACPIFLILLFLSQSQKTSAIAYITSIPLFSRYVIISDLWHLVSPKLAETLTRC